MQHTHIHRWPSAWLQHLQCVSNGDTADPHMDTYIPNMCMYCKHINSYKCGIYSIQNHHYDHHLMTIICSSGSWLHTYNGKMPKGLADNSTWTMITVPLPPRTLPAPEQALCLPCCNCNLLVVCLSRWYSCRKFEIMCILKMLQRFQCSINPLSKFILDVVYSKMKPKWCQMVMVIMTLNYKSLQSIS